MESPAETTPPVPSDAAPPDIVPSPKHPGVWSGLGTVALYFLLQFGLSILVGALIAVALGVAGGFHAATGHHKFDPHAVTRLIQQNPDIRVILTVLTIAAAAAVMTALVRRTWPAQWSRGELPGFGFVQPDSKLAYPGAVLLGVAVLLAGAALTNLFAGSNPVQQDVALMADKVSPDMRILLALLVVCVAPFVEELVFRGVLLSGLASRMRSGWAIVASALIFGCAHLPDFKFAWYPVPALVLLGLALAWLRLKTRSIWPSITLHATNNFVAAMTWFMVAGH